ncbi:MAG: regulatory protein RecX [Mariprofundaceae bacterium]
MALRMLTRREHCAVELQDKLMQRGCDEIAVDSALELLKHYGYLSEARYAEAFLRARMKKGEMPWMAAEKARQKGVEEAALQTALEEAEDEYDTIQACRDLLKRRDPQDLHRKHEKNWQREARYLRNKGFDADTILRALNTGKDED